MRDDKLRLVQVTIVPICEWNIPLGEGYIPNNTLESWRNWECFCWNAVEIIKSLSARKQPQNAFLDVRVASVQCWRRLSPPLDLSWESNHEQNSLLNYSWRWPINPGPKQRRSAEIKMEEMVKLGALVKRGDSEKMQMDANGTAESVRARACVAAVMLDADMKYSTLNPTNCRDFLLPATLRWHKQALSLDWPRCLEADKFSEMAWLFIQGQDPSCLQLALSSQQWLLIERRMRKITLLPHNGCHSSLKSTEATEAVLLANSIMGIIYPSVAITFRLSASIQ